MSYILSVSFSGLLCIMAALFSAYMAITLSFEDRRTWYDDMFIYGYCAAFVLYTYIAVSAVIALVFWTV